MLKAVSALGQRVGGLKAGRFRLEKNIPVAAGIGGGSADAAAALRLLARANGIAAGDARLMDAARAVGADVPVCLASRPCIMRGVGEQLAQLDMPRLPAVLVNPGVALGDARRVRQICRYCKRCADRRGAADAGSDDLVSRATRQ